MRTKPYDVSETIFGTKMRKVCMRELSRKSKIPEPTLYRHRSHPSRMNLADFSRIVRSLGMSDEDIVKVIRGV